MTLKEYLTLLIFPELEPHHQMQFSVVQYFVVLLLLLIARKIHRSVGVD